MNGTILTSILAGSRIQPVSEGLKFDVIKVKQEPQSQFEPKDSIKPLLLLAEKKSNHKAFIPKISIGILASSVSVSVDPHYSILAKHLLGSRVGYDGAKAFMAPAPLSEQPTKNYIGISTYGIRYTPVVSDTSTKLELRRWPRNWYGDNIKN